jgi:flavin reductase (DIM6/NTAB) family NADH-FMN oxidoreductase RutF
MLNESLRKYAYRWPDVDLAEAAGRQFTKKDRGYIMKMPEKAEDVFKDSRWPAFFPSSISLVTTGEGSKTALEKVVGAAIVNRFPYIVALNFCKDDLSGRHHPRQAFIDTLERSGCAAIQFLPPGEDLDNVMQVINTVPEPETHKRIAQTGLKVRKGETNPALVFDSSYMVYETRLVKPGKDFDGVPIYHRPWIDVGSHRIYFLEINAIQLRRDIADGSSQVLWRSLPAWEPQSPPVDADRQMGELPMDGGYVKPFDSHYKFPAENTVAFETDEVKDRMAVKYLAPLPEDQVEVDNDRARWPCFFPSSLGMITSYSEKGVPNVMPCGSTFMVSRYPLTVGICVSYAAINERYAPRASLDFIQKNGAFGCGVPFINDTIRRAIGYAGNLSMKKDPQKLANSGLFFEDGEWGPVLTDIPIYFGCKVKEEIKLGTHILFLGEVQEIRVRRDVTPDNAMEWCPWVDILKNED